jgi:hypothetical protein
MSVDYDSDGCEYSTRAIACVLHKPNYLGARRSQTRVYRASIDYGDGRNRLRSQRRGNQVEQHTKEVKSYC